MALDLGDRPPPSTGSDALHAASRSCPAPQTLDRHGRQPLPRCVHGAQCDHSCQFLADTLLRREDHRLGGCLLATRCHQSQQRVSTAFAVLPPSFVRPPRSLQDEDACSLMVDAPQSSDASAESLGLFALQELEDESRGHKWRQHALRVAPSTPPSHTSEPLRPTHHRSKQKPRDARSTRP
ncbi:hypothetical protein P43SY_000323 [Pythium insidiosum]|uniref:Uncharacterized protein n=1 Tax=Pythium insidiosum TaxID=114742 RepID=A0AAD5L7W7_PYTIN|nr:hypothetical protein P43SY_000323 [Pythium insidiosum]